MDSLPTDFEGIPIPSDGLHKALVRQEARISSSISQHCLE
jgi:hypothetical protein